MALGADEMKVPGVAVGRLETGTALTEIDFPRDACIDHPLQRSVHGRASNPRIFPSNQVAQLVGAQVPLLTQEDRQDPITLAGPFTARGAQARNVGKGALHVSW